MRGDNELEISILEFVFPKPTRKVIFLISKELIFPEEMFSKSF